MASYSWRTAGEAKALERVEQTGHFLGLLDVQLQSEMASLQDSLCEAIDGTLKWLQPDM
jgi:hypothetical protein